MPGQKFVMAQGIQTDRVVQTEQGGNHTELFTVWYDPAMGKAECRFNTVRCFELMQEELETGRPFGTMRDIAFYCMNASQVALQYDQQMLAIIKHSFQNQVNQEGGFENWSGSFYGDEEQYEEEEPSMLNRKRRPKKETKTKAINIHDEYEEEVASKVNTNLKPKPKKASAKAKKKSESNIHQDSEGVTAPKVNTNLKSKSKPKKTKSPAKKVTRKKTAPKEEGELSESSDYEPDIVNKSKNARKKNATEKEKPEIVGKKKKETNLLPRLTRRKAAEILKSKGL